MAYTVKRLASSGATSRKVLCELPAPWTITRGGPPPLRQAAIGVPSVETTLTISTDSVTNISASRKLDRFAGASLATRTVGCGLPRLSGADVTQANLWTMPPRHIARTRYLGDTTSEWSAKPLVLP